MTTLADIDKRTALRLGRARLEELVRQWQERAENLAAKASRSTSAVANARWRRASFARDRLQALLDYLTAREGA